MNMKRRGFTILELLLVIVLISVLMTIVVIAATASIRLARGQRAEAMRVALQAAISTYQAADPEGKWPAPIQEMADSARSGILNESDAQRVFQIIVQKSLGMNGSQLLLVDPHMLFVAKAGAVEGQSSGLSFDDARQGDARRQPWPVASMVFGFQTGRTGKFYSFKISYNAKTDSVVVSACCRNCVTMSGCREMGRCSCHE